MYVWIIRPASGTLHFATRSGYPLSLTLAQIVKHFEENLSFMIYKINVIELN